MSVDLVTSPLIDDIIEIIMRCRIESTFKAILEGEFIQEDGLYRACSYALKRFPSFSGLQNLVMQRSWTKQRKSTPNRKNYGQRAPRSKDYVYNEPKRSYKAIPLGKCLTKILHAKLQILYEHKVTFRVNFIELLRHWLDVDEFIDNLYNPDFMRCTSANNIIVSHILSENHMPFLYEWLAADGPYNTDDDMIRHLKIHLEMINRSIRKYWTFALAFDKQSARDAMDTLTTLTFHKSYSLFKKYLTDLEEEIIHGNDWTAGDNIREIKCLENYTYLFRNDKAKSTALKRFMRDCHQAPINNTARIACEVSIGTLVELLFETSNSPQK
ncbi:26450_t:CDS:2, partial [Gigaspora margarita]